MEKLNKKRNVAISLCAIGGLSLLCYADSSFAVDTIGTMASSVTKTFASIGKLITAGSYIAGLGMSVGAIMKFKQHKDNPTQVQIGQPISLVLIAAALLFMPTLLKTVGATMFGTASSAGPSGTTISGA